jgi:hypothetical protein
MFKPVSIYLSKGAGIVGFLIRDAPIPPPPAPPPTLSRFLKEFIVKVTFFVGSCGFCGGGNGSELTTICIAAAFVSSFFTSS